MKKYLVLMVVAAMCVVAGCTKPEPDPVTDTSVGVYVLNEGGWGANNASLSVITEDGIVNDWFAQKNGRGLGDLGQDLLHYGSKLYAVVNGSNTVECIDTKTGVSAKQIALGTSGPRYAVAHGGKVYVSCYNKTVVRIDTASLEVEATCQLSGMQPEQLCIVGGNLYVCSTWQYASDNSAEYDNKVTVVDLATFEETGKITVGLNPTRLCAIDGHRLLVACTGDYGSTAAKTLVVDLNDGTQTELPVAVTNMTQVGNEVYLYCTSYAADWSTVANFYKMDVPTLEVTPILEAHSGTLNNAYGIGVDPDTKDIYVCNSQYGMNGDVYVFSSTGEQIGRYEAGMLASKVVF